MARHTETIAQKDTRNLTNEAVSNLLENKRKEYSDKFGPGLLNFVFEPNGDIAVTYDYAESFSASHPAHGIETNTFNEDATTLVAVSDEVLDGIDEEELDAILHARIVLCNHSHVKFNSDTGQYEATISEDEDPAIDRQLTSINALERLLARNGKATNTGTFERKS